jgi:hypothetical protein
MSCIGSATLLSLLSSVPASHPLSEMFCRYLIFFTRSSVSYLRLIISRSLTVRVADLLLLPCTTTIMAGNLLLDLTTFLSFQSLKRELQLLHYYAGLETAGKLMNAFTTLGPAVHTQNYCRKTVDDNILPIGHFILMLARLRQNMGYLPLSKLCCVSIYSAQNSFITWLNFCSRQWSEVNLWRHKDLVQFYAPADFMAQFPRTRVIVDGTEIPVQQPSNPVSQREPHSVHIKTET